MSGWDAYINNLKDSAPCITKGALIGDNGSIWAKSPDFNISSEEAATFAGLWQNVANVPQTGFTLEGTKYICPRADPDDAFILGKRGADGIMAIKTNTACVIAQFKGESQEGVQTRKAVEYIADYLKKSNY